MNQVHPVLDDVVSLLIKSAPPSVLIDFVSRAHRAEKDEGRREFVEGIHARAFLGGGLPGHVPKEPSNQSLIKLYQRFGYLIPEEYRIEGIKRAEAPKEVRYNPATQQFYFSPVNP